jgi:O-antigen ligase
LKNQHFINICLLSSFALAPFFGSTILILIATVSIWVFINYSIKQPTFSDTRPFKLIGLIQLSYFASFFILELYHSETMIQQLRDQAKTFPILVIGLTAFLLYDKTIPITFHSISTAAIIGVFISTIVPFLLSASYPYTSHLLAPIEHKIALSSRLTMGSGNPLPFGTLLITLSFLSIVHLKKRSVTGKLFAIGALLLGTLTVAFWNQSRGPMLATIPLGLITIWYVTYSGNWSESIKYTLKIFFILVVIVLLGTTIIEKTNSLHQTKVAQVYQKLKSGLLTFSSGENQDESVYRRTVMYKSGVKAALRSPLIGHGIKDRFTATIPYRSSDITWAYTHLHSTFINHFVAGGIVGLFFLFLIIFSPLINLYKNNTHNSLDATYCALITVTSMFFNGLTNVLLMHDLISGFFGILILVGAIALKNYNKEIHGNF